MEGNTIRKSDTDWMQQPILVEQIFELSPDCMMILSVKEQRFLHVNQYACTLFGYASEDFVNIPLKELFSNSSEFKKLKNASSLKRIGETVEVELMGKRATGSIIFMRLRYSRIDYDRALVIIKDISEQQQIALLNKELSEIVELQEQYNHKIHVGREVLKMVAKQQDLKDVLDLLCQGIERLVENLRVSVMLAQDGQLTFGAAPSMPQSFIDQVEGAAIAADGLPCGVAVHSKEEVLVEDMLTSERFAHCRAVTEEYQIRSCWSVPILSSDGNQVLGSFAFYSHEPQQVSFSLSDLIAMATDLAAVAIEQYNNRKRLTAVNRRYIQQNQELQAAKQQLETDKRIVLDREQKLKDAQRLSKVGSWELDMLTNELTWSKQQYLIYELEGTSTEGLYTAYVDRIYPDDIDNMVRAIINIQYPTTVFNYEHRLLCEENDLRYILGTGRVEYNEKQEIICLKGTEQDVTSLKLAEQRALRNELQFNELVANINEILFMVDIKNPDSYDNPFSYINGDTLSLFGYTQEELMENYTLWSDCIHPEDKEAVTEQGKALHFHKDKITREYRFKHKDGHYIWIEDNVSVGNDEESEHWRVYGSARDITQRKASEAASLEIKERLELAKNAAKLGNYDWKMKENELHWDDRMYEIFGVEEGLSIEAKHNYINDALHEEDRERVINTFTENIASDNKIYNYQSNYRILVKDKIKYIENYVILMRNDAGEVDRVIGTCLDVTERKEAEKLLISNEEKDVLLKEIHHRVKNNLQVITSLLSLQSNSLEDNKQRKIFADSQYRINSMAIVHELLYQSDNLSKVDYKEYLQQLSQFLIRSIKGTDNKIQLDLDVPNIKLSIDTAIPLGLLINEVLTNSLKYGIKGDEAGSISIRIVKATLVEEGTPNYILEIGDDGIGYPDNYDYRSSKSLGLKLIHNLTRQLEGSICKDANKKGTNYIITFKEV